MIQFDWSDAKAKLNFQKHNVWFSEAETVWADRRAIEIFDSLHSVDEDRYLRIGHAANGKILLVVFSENELGLVRIISARNATNRERRFYEEGI